MKLLSSFVFFLAVLIAISCAKSCNAFRFMKNNNNNNIYSSTSYNAASTQHYPRNLTTPNLSIRDKKAINLNIYEELLVSATSSSVIADIIVFPESGTGYIMVSD